MKLAVISDLHLGDPTSSLVTHSSDGYVLGPHYDLLTTELKKSGTLDYLVLLGDVFDFSITRFSDAYEASKPFLAALAADGIAKEVIYLPGNHDFSAWALTMQEANTINQIKAGAPLKDRWSVPAIIDSRSDAKLKLSGVNPQEDGSYGGLFFDKLGNITFNVAYPNLYIVDKKGFTTLVTHGHYFEGYWSFTSTLAAKVFQQELNYASHSSQASVEELVAVNFPLNNLASSGLGMAGPLTPLIRQIEADAKAGEFGHIKTYLKRLRNYIDDQLHFEGFFGHIKEFLSDKFLDAAMNKVLDSVKTAQGPTASPSRYNEKFFKDPVTLQNISRFLEACELERKEIRNRQDIDLPAPGRVLFGHTHVPILSTNPHIENQVSSQSIEFWNTGGWLKGPSGVPSAVFIYDDAVTTGSPWSSTRV